MQWHPRCTHVQVALRYITWTVCTQLAHNTILVLLLGWGTGLGLGLGLGLGTEWGFLSGLLLEGAPAKLLLKLELELELELELVLNAGAWVGQEMKPLSVLCPALLPAFGNCLPHLPHFDYACRVAGRN